MIGNCIFIFFFNKTGSWRALRWFDVLDLIKSSSFLSYIDFALDYGNSCYAIDFEENFQKA